MRTNGNTEILSDCKKDIIDGNITLGKLHASIAPFMGLYDFRIFKLVSDFPKKWFFDSKFLTDFFYGVDSWIVREEFYEKKGIFSRGRDFEHRNLFYPKYCFNTFGFLFHFALVFTRRRM